MKKTSLALLLVTALCTTSCLGPNNAFNGVTSWNTRATDSKWLNEVIYIGMWIIPVYPITLTLDTLIFNSFEFWGGENPISTPTPPEKQGGK